MKIHPTAIIAPEAKLAPDVEVGPYSLVGPDVTLAAMFEREVGYFSSWSCVAGSESGSESE